MVVTPSAKALIIRLITRKLSSYVDERRTGEVYSEGACSLTREPQPTMRQPDVSFLSTARLNALDNDYFAGAPDLAVEVVSPGNDAAELDLKVNQYLTYGSKEVWVVYPKTRSVFIYQTSGKICKLSEQDTITSDLFRGWSARVAEFFHLAY